MMARSVLDSSVLVSALLTPHGTSGAVLDAAERGVFCLCLSPAILAETASVLTRNPKLQARYGYDDVQVAAFCAGLQAVAEIETDLPELAGAVPLDPKDDVIVATAVATRAGYLVTGDRRHLLSLGAYEGIRIVTPREFLDLLEDE
jgi:putative PIN family toxin of toxin-antitoxin system